MINEVAAINAVKNGRQYVTQADLFRTVEVVIAGKEKKKTVSWDRKRKDWWRTMKLVMHWLQHYRKMQSRYRRSQSYRVPWDLVGYTLQMPEEEKYLETKAELEARLVTYMGGRPQRRSCAIL